MMQLVDIDGKANKIGNMDKQNAAVKLLTAREVLDLVPWAIPTLYHQSQRGGFVAPVRLGGKLLWPADEVHAWLAQRLADRVQRTSVPRSRTRGRSIHQQGVTPCKTQR